MNETPITLIPKQNLSKRISHFHPIVLCNVVVKGITKIIANWLKALMPGLVGEQQCSFVSGRQGIDNVVIVQKVMHSMRKKIGKRGWMAVKLDLEKAYDRIS